MYRLIDFEVKASWLKETSILLQKGMISIDEACKSVDVRTILGEELTISIGKSQVKKLFKENGMKLYERGRKGWKKELKPEVTQKIITEYQNIGCGITKLWEKLNKDNIKVSRKDVEKVYKNILNIPGKNKKKVPKPRCRYLITQVNGAWHGDIHYLNFNNEIRYLFVLIDDRSRFIVNYGIFFNKTAVNVVAVLSEVVSLYGPPLIFWSDNGSENVNQEMDEFLENNHIARVTTLPGNPQSNGKIEKFWPPLEKKLKKCNSWEQIKNQIQNYIEMYNYHLPHNGLEKINGFHAYPSEIFFNERFKKTNLEECKINIDGRGEVSLRSFFKIPKKIDFRKIEDLLN